METCNDETWGFFVEIDNIQMPPSLKQHSPKIQKNTNHIVCYTPILYLFCIFEWFYKKGISKKI